MDSAHDSKLSEKLKEVTRISQNLKDAESSLLVEILYEYLSEHISTHFEKTIEGIDTLHNSLIARQKEHAEIMTKLATMEERLKKIEAVLDRI
jgi:hypothetical protein